MHEEEYLMPILRLLYSDDIIFINNNTSTDLILTQKHLTTEKPYILMNGEARLRHDYNYNKALTDKNCIACIVTSLDYDDNTKTFYVPFFLDRGHQYFTESPFIRKHINNERPYLAAYVASHSPPHRDDFFRELRALDNTVDGLGKANHTKDISEKVGEKWWEAVDYYKNYIFGFAMENTYEDGYITEKIMNVYIGGAIPLYWGTSRVKEIFNPESFVYLNDFTSLKDAAKYVKELSNDEQRMKKMREASIFIKDSPYEKYYNIPAPQWVVDISNKIKDNMNKI